MWFTPAFFIVSFIYYVFAKTISKIFKPSKELLAWIGCAFFFVVYYVTRYFFMIPTKAIFSLRTVPEYLFYFSVGAVAYIYICKCKALEKTPVFLKVLNFVTTVFSIAYFVIYFYKKENLIWGWTATAFGSKLSFLPNFVTSLLMYFVLSCVARCISCNFTARIGRSSLGLCHCEVFTKQVITLAANIIGLTVKATNPIEAVIFALILLIVGCFVILPATDMLTKRILSVNNI